MLHREHESVARKKLNGFVAGGFIGEAQLNASDLERETTMLISGLQENRPVSCHVPDRSGKNSE